MAVLLRDQCPTYVYQQYIVCLLRKGKWRALAAKAESMDRLVGGRNNVSKYKKGRRKTPLRLCSRGTEEYTPLGSVVF